MDEMIIEQVLEKCREHFGTGVNGIIKVKEFGDGKSGNKVLMIEVLDSNDAKKNGRYVLKISVGETEEFFNEILNTVQLGNIQENIDDIIFPRYETAGNVGSTLYYVYDVAGSELNDSIRLSGMMSSGEYILEKISKGLLVGWNEKFCNKKINIVDCVRDMLGIRKLDGNGRLITSVNYLIGDALAPTYYYGNELLPNPYFYLNNLHGPLEHDLNAVVGKIHGDLNCNNIIVNKNFMNDNYEIYLIDYSHYKNNAFLFFDNAYLQLNLLLTGQSASNVFTWYADIVTIAESKSKKNRLVNSIYNGVLTFINKYQPNNKENCWIQYMCAQIAVGLNWMSKRDIDEIGQALCFLYASVYLKKLLNILKCEMEAGTDVKLTLLGGDRERKIWELVNQFNTLDNRYILMSSCDLDDIEKEKFECFSGIKWESIFHITKTANDEIGKDFVPKIKKTYGIQYKLLPDEKEGINCEMAPTWCTVQVPDNCNMKVWYRQNLQIQLNRILKAILSMRENYPIYIILLKLPIPQMGLVP